MLDFGKYFKSDHDAYLNNIEFNIIENKNEFEGIELECIDDLVVKSKNDMKVNYIFTRKIKFNPSCLYELSVSYGFSLVYNQDVKAEIDWSNIDFVKEIKENKNIYLGDVISRVSLHIAQISSSSGQIPIITPPSFCT